MLKIKCHDKYNEQDIIITLGNDDEMHYSNEYSNSNGIWHKQTIRFEAVEGDKDGCDPSRWSDLTNFEIIDEKENEQNKNASQ